MAAAAVSAAGKAGKAIGALGREVLTGPRQPSGEEQFVVTKRQVLGRAAPGEALPLPLGWAAPGRQLQLRPVLPADGRSSASSVGEPPAEGQEEEEEADQLQAVHDWSRGAAEGPHTLRLDGLDDGATRLVCCSALGDTGARTFAGWWA